MRVPKDLAQVLQLDEELFADRFAIEAEAGVGGMGVVYRAFDQLRGERVALKILHEADPAALQRFDAEVRALAKLRHPGIVQYIAHGVDAEGDPYLAMEWVVGETLHARLREGTLDIADALILGARLAGALESAHTVGVLHRDIKPSNVLLPAKNVHEAKLADFGLAQIGEEGQHERGDDAVSGECIVGTPGYMAPEQARGSHDLDGRSDLFSLGCLLFRCLTGAEAFPGTADFSASAKVMLLEPPPLSELHPEAPVALSRLVAHLLAKNPEERPASARAVREELERIARASREIPRAPPSEVRTLESAPEVLFGRYVLEGPPAGTGGVFLARDPMRNRHVALRVFGAVRDPVEIAQLLREARAVAGVNHPNLAVILDVGEHAGVAFVAREHLTGERLRRYMRDPAVEFEQRVCWLHQIASGLAAAHRAGVAHGDVCPDNILVPGGEAREIKLLDFRLAGIGGDARGDQYAWGVIAYELLTGCSLADGIDLNGVSPPMADVIRRTLHEQPDERFATMDDVLEALEDREAARRKVGRTRGAWAVGLVGLAALFAGIFMSAVATRTTDPLSGAPPAAAAVARDELVPRNPDAVAHVEAGLQYLREASVARAVDSFYRALNVEPDLATAHLYLAVVRDLDGTEVAKHYREATIHHDQLSPRDRALLDAFSSAVTVPRDLNASQQGLTAALVRFPSDWLIANTLVRVHFDKHEYQRSAEVSDRILRSEPSQALAFYQRGLAEGAYDRERARDSMNECLRVSPQADRCLEWLMTHADDDGQCADVERYARILVQPPHRPELWWVRSLAGAIIARGDTIEHGREVFVNSFANDDKRFSKGDIVPSFDMLGGAFVQAQRILDDRATWSRSETHGGWHEWIMHFQFDMTKELNDVPRMKSLAAQHLIRLEGWLSSNQMEGRMLPWRMQYYAGVLSREAFDEHRQRWMKNEAPTKDYFGTKDVWFLAYAQASKTKEDFAEAYRIYREQYENVPYHGGSATLADDLLLGRVCLFAGDVERALPLLRRAANRCGVVQSPFEHTWANLDLGMALERTGDVPGACAAYDVVVQRWGKEPRSVSAKSARTRRAALHCAAKVD